MERFSALLIFITLSLQSVHSIAAAPELKPARNFGDIVFSGAMDLTNVVKVQTAKILTADYALIRGDFPQVAGLGEKEIDQWLIDQVGYISQNQVQLGTKNGTNQPFNAIKTEIKKALRPPSYNRALVYYASGGGLIDVKGVGSEMPLRKTHGNGLMETAEAIREHFYTKAVKEVLIDAKAEYGVVDSYAVLDWGFHLNDLESDQTFRAGAILRQAHVRDYMNPRSQGQLENKATKEVEVIIRKYGVTSALNRKVNSQLNLDNLNVQGTKDGRFLFDFGSYRVMDKFENRAISIVDWVHELEKWESSTLLDPHLPNFPQPNPEKRLSYELWNGAGNKSDQEKIWLKARELAAELDQKKPIEEVRAKLEKLLSEYKKINHGAVPHSPYHRSSCFLEIINSLKNINYN